MGKLSPILGEIKGWQLMSARVEVSLCLSTERMLARVAAWLDRRRHYGVPSPQKGKAWYDDVEK